MSSDATTTLLDSRLGRFVTIAFAILLVAIPLSALVAPPDPYTQIVVAGSLLVFVLPMAYLLSHPTVYVLMRGD
jgi:cation transport ATPase